jgi:haloalkane dehalogenase
MSGNTTNRAIWLGPPDARDARRPAWLDEQLYPFASQYRDIEGNRVHYIDEGSGPPLLLLHGNPTWSFLYRDIIKGLRDHFRCVALDYPGFGLSTAAPEYAFTPAEHARVVERFMLDLDLSEITVMMQDWGGPIGLGVAGRHPDRFGALVIGNSWAWPVNGEPRFERFSRFAGGPVGSLLIRHFNAFVNLGIPAGVKRHKPPQEVMAAYRGPFARRAARRPVHVFPREIIASRAYLAEVEHGLTRLAHLPALITWGDRDDAYGEPERRRFEALFPRHRTVHLRGAGHFIQEDAADEIVAAIRDWWEKDVEQ